MIGRTAASLRRRVLASLAGLLVACATSHAVAEVPTDQPVLHVLTSGGFAAALKQLAPAFEKTAHVRLEISYGASMGSTIDAIPSRLDRGEPADVVILAREALDKLIENGRVGAGSRADLAQSRIAMAVKVGTTLPDISSMEAFRQTLLAARSVAWSDSASGAFLQNVLFPRMGLDEAMKAKGRMVAGTPVGQVVSRGQAEIGFQQMSELKPIAGITVVGAIPPAAQKLTVFSAGIVARSVQPEAARALIAYLASPQAAQAIKDSGMEKVEAR